MMDCSLSSLHDEYVDVDANPIQPLIALALTPKHEKSS